MKQLGTIFVIWVGCAIAWAILGGTVAFRTTESEGLNSQVDGLWGPSLLQLPPAFTYTAQTPTDEVLPNGTHTVRMVETREAIPLTQTQVDVDLNLAHRQKGLRWFATYDAGFRGTFRTRNESNEARRIRIEFPLPTSDVAHAHYASRSERHLSVLVDSLTITQADGTPLEVEAFEQTATAFLDVPALSSAEIRVAYHTRGTGSFSYDPSRGGTVQAKRVALNIRTNVAEIDFVPGTLSPNRQSRPAGRWQGTWSFENLLGTAAIGVQLPDRIQPGDAASRITFFAPISLLFFFFVVALLAYVQKVALHPMHYFFFGTAFFAFHLLFAYLADRTPLAATFGICAAVSMTLLISYVRLFAGWKFALREVGIAQLIYLVGFSATFFLPGFTGLTITIGAILTLFLVMQVTGKIEWHANNATAQDQPGIARVS